MADLISWKGYKSALSRAVDESG